MSIQPQPCAPAAHRRTSCGPLLDLLRTALLEHGEITLRRLPADHEAARTGYVDPLERVIGLHDDPDDVEFLVSFVLSLNQLSVADVDPRLEDAAWEFVKDSSRRTLATLGVSAQ